MMIKKKKTTKKTQTKKKINKSPAKKNNIDLRADGERFWNSKSGKNIISDLNGEILAADIVNVFDEARKVKDWQQLENFVEIYMPGLDVADAAVLLTEYARDNWMVIKILKDPESLGAVSTLLSQIDNVPGGAVKIFNGHVNEEKEDVLEAFCMDTGYKKPKAVRTFQNDVTFMKNYFGIKRHKREDVFRDKGDKEFSIFNRPKNLK